MLTSYTKTERKLYKKFKANLLKWYGVAEKNGFQGLYWYDGAHEFCQQLCDQFNIPIYQACGIVAAYSRNCGWSQNQIYAVRYLSKDKTFKGLPNARVHSDAIMATKNYQECLSMFRNFQYSDKAGAMVEGPVSAQKLLCFFLNLMVPDFTVHVEIQRTIKKRETYFASTIDRHMGRVVWNDTSEGKFPTSKYSGRKYAIIAHAMADLAEELSILPQQLQAVIWVAFRDFKGLTKQYG